MTDPYKVLGISPSATDDQVKQAYRELAKKYHPDNYANNPLADLAQEKMKDINEAYDTIVNQRKQGNSYGSYGSSGGYGSSGSYGGYGSYGGSSGSSYSGSSQFADIRQMIRNNRIEEAEELLNGIPQSGRDAEWHFLKGSICYSRGWMDDAAGYFTRACNMDPANQEYKAALNQLLWQQNGGTRTRNPYSTVQSGDDCGFCDICSGLMCLDCLCSSGRMCC